MIFLYSKLLPYRNRAATVVRAGHILGGVRDVCCDDEEDMKSDREHGGECGLESPREKKAGC